LFPALEDFQDLSVYGHLPLRVCRLHISYSLPDNSALHAEFAVEPIHIGPLQRQALADAKPEANTNQRDCAKWFPKMLNKLLKLSNSQTPGAERKVITL